MIGSILAFLLPFCACSPYLAPAPEMNNQQQKESNPRPRRIQKRMILKGVNFKEGTAILEEGSFAFLDMIVENLKAYPDLTIEISAHVDRSDCRAIDECDSLSKNMAQSVKRYILEKGIAESMIKAVGRGCLYPISGSKSESGIKMNRRIEVQPL